MRRQTIVVKDAAEADFGTASRHVEPRTIDQGYRYTGHGWAWWVASALLYWVVAPVVVFTILAIYGVRFTNRAAVRRAGGVYLYANHSHWTDSLLPYALAWPRRAYIVAGPTAVSIPFVRHIVGMLGGVPLNTTPAGKETFRAFLAGVVAKGHPVGIYPEAHEWPYYTGIRDFSARSFTYPVRTGAPVLPYVVTYRARRWRKNRPPKLTVTVGEVIPPSVWEGTADPKQVARDAVHTWMVDTVRRLGSVEWVRYELEPGPEAG